MSYHKTIIATITIATLYSNTSLASDDAEVKLAEGVTLTPNLSVQTGHNSNLIRSATDEISTGYLGVLPSVEVAFEGRSYLTAVNYDIDARIYFASPQDDYEDHNLAVTSDHVMNRKNRLGVYGSAAWLHEARGTGFSQGGSVGLDEPDTYFESDVGGYYEFGAKETRGLIRIDGGLLSKRFDSRFVAGSDVTLGRDYDQSYAAVAYTGRVKGNTNAVVEYRTASFDYSYAAPGSNSLDSDNNNALLGLEWDVTGKSTGGVKIGYVEKSFDSSARNTFNALNWDVSAQYMANTYTSLLFTSARNVRETSGIGNLIDNTAYRAELNHEYRQGRNIRFALSHSDDDYEGAVNVRVDKIKSMSVAYTAEFDRWINGEISYAYEDKSSSDASFEYEGHVVQFAINMAL